MTLILLLWTTDLDCWLITLLSQILLLYLFSHFTKKIWSKYIAMEQGEIPALLQPGQQMFSHIFDGQKTLWATEPWILISNLSPELLSETNVEFETGGRRRIIVTLFLNLLTEVYSQLMPLPIPACVLQALQEPQSPFLTLFIYSFIFALGLHCCGQAFSSCSEQGLLFLAVCRLLIVVASLVVEHGL